MTDSFLSKAVLNKFKCESNPKSDEIGACITTNILLDKLLIHSPPIQFISYC